MGAESSFLSAVGGPFGAAGIAAGAIPPLMDAAGDSGNFLVFGKRRQQMLLDQAGRSGAMGGLQDWLGNEGAIRMMGLNRNLMGARDVQGLGEGSMTSAEQAFLESMAEKHQGSLASVAARQTPNDVWQKIERARDRYGLPQDIFQP